MKIEIQNRWTGDAIYTGEHETALADMKRLAEQEAARSPATTN